MCQITRTSLPSRLVMPNHDADLIDTVRLSLVDGVGPRIRRRLLDRFGDPAAVLAAAPSELREVEGVGPKALRADPPRRRRDRRRGRDRLVPQPGHRHPHRDPRRISPRPPRNPRSAGPALRPRHAQTGRRPGHRHRRHAARHGLRTAAGRTAGGQPGPGRTDDHQRPGPRDRCGRPSRRAGGRRPHARHPRQRRDEHLSARTRQAGRSRSRPAAR